MSLWTRKCACGRKFELGMLSSRQESCERCIAIALENAPRPAQPQKAVPSGHRCDDNVFACGRRNADGSRPCDKATKLELEYAQGIREMAVEIKVLRALLTKNNIAIPEELAA